MQHISSEINNTAYEKKMQKFMCKSQSATEPNYF